jgi:hypothetical protein
MATHRIALVITDEDIAGLDGILDGILETIDILAANYQDDWGPDEEPLSEYCTQYAILHGVLDRIKLEVAP